MGTSSPGLHAVCTWASGDVYFSRLFDTSTSSLFRTLVEMGYHFLMNCLYHVLSAEKKNSALASWSCSF